jgi:hypothetical protein
MTRVHGVQGVQGFSDKRLARAYETTNGKTMHWVHWVHWVHSEVRADRAPLPFARKISSLSALSGAIHLTQTSPDHESGAKSLLLAHVEQQSISIRSRFSPEQNVRLTIACEPAGVGNRRRFTHSLIASTKSRAFLEVA